MTAILGACAGAVSGSGGGGGGTTVSIADDIVYDSATGTVTATYSLNSDGTISTGDVWKYGSGASSDYEVYATLSSGTLTSGTTGSWLGLGTTRTWTVSNSLMNNSVKTAVIALQIRAVAAPATILDTATITLEAESDNTF